MYSNSWALRGAIALNYQAIIMLLLGSVAVTLPNLCPLTLSFLPPPSPSVFLSVPDFCMPSTGMRQGVSAYCFPPLHFFVLCLFLMSLNNISGYRDTPLYTSLPCMATCMYLIYSSKDTVRIGSFHLL